MKEEPKNFYHEEKAKKELLIFDRGLSEITVKKYKEKEVKQKINWFVLYKIFFKNVLNSKDVIPIDELVLRFNIIRNSLPKYYKGYKGNDSNSSAIIKKFTYHICKNKKRKKSPLILKQNSEEKNRNLKFDKKMISDGNISFKKRSEKKTKTVKVTNKLNLDFLNKNKNNKNNNFLRPNKASGLEVLLENDDFSVGNGKKNEESEKNLNLDLPNLQLINKNKKKLTIINRNKRSINSIENINKKESKESKELKDVKVKVKFNNNNILNSARVKFNNNTNKDNSKDDNDEGNEIILGTPTDSEFPLVLSQKRSYNTKPSFFFESLNKIKELTKHEKIKTFQKEFTSQILKFNDLYFDPKIDDFYNDKLFNDVKATCDLFINKFHIDSEEEKNLADLDNYL